MVDLDRLRSGAGWTPEVAARKAELDERDQRRDEYWQALRRGRWVDPWGRFAVDFHPHDAPPSEPPVPGLTPKERWQADALVEHVVISLRCTWVDETTGKQCPVTGTYYGRRDRLEEWQARGGPRCVDHPLDDTEALGPQARNPHDRRPPPDDPKAEPVGQTGTRPTGRDGQAEAPPAHGANPTRAGATSPAEGEPSYCRLCNNALCDGVRCTRGLG